MEESAVYILRRIKIPGIHPPKQSKSSAANVQLKVRRAFSVQFTAENALLSKPVNQYHIISFAQAPKITKREIGMIIE